MNRYRWMSLLIGCGVALLCGANGASAAEPVLLKPNSPVERMLGGTETHAYAVSLPKGRVLELVVDQRGVDVVVRILSAVGKELASFDAPNGDQGPEPVAWVAAEAGDYRVTVTPLEPGAKPGRYEIRLTGMRRATRAELEQAKTEPEIRKAEEEWARAVAGYDLDSVRRIAADGFNSWFAGPSDGGTVSRDQLCEVLKTNRESDPKTTRQRELARLMVRVDGDLAFTRGAFTSTVIRGARQTRSDLAFSHLWRRQAGAWRLEEELMAAGEPEAVHAARVPVPEEILDAFAGSYETALGVGSTVERAGDHLVRTTGSFKSELYPISETEFVDPTGRLQMTFVRDRNGKVTHAVWAVAGHASKLTRVP